MVRCSMSNWEQDKLDALVGWVDKYNIRTREEIGLRVLKVFEEAGEAAQAWIGYTGQNPRKGITHTPDDVVNELLDLAITALVAAQSVKGSSVWYDFTGKMVKIMQRNQEYDRSRVSEMKP